MASNEQPPAKRVKVSSADTNNVSTFHDRPKRHAVSELYNPTMIEVYVYDHEDDPEAEKQRMFVIPRGLICNRFEYFDRMFNSNFVEAQNLYAELDDVPPWLFKCFVGWLYTHCIFYDPDWVDPVNFEEVEEDWDGEAEAQGNSQSSGTGEPTETVGAPTRPVTHLELKSKVLQTSVFGGSNETEPNMSLAAMQLSTDHVPAEVEGSDYEPDEEDFDDPITWPWMELFKLYVFADKYATRDFQTIIFDIIQKRLRQQRPREYRLPHRTHIKFAVDRLPPSSPLFRFLVDVTAVQLDLDRLGDTPVQQASAMEEMPNDYLAACFISSARHHRAVECKDCEVAEGEDCKESSHTAEEVYQARDRDPCYYHDHGEDKAAAQECASRWSEWFKEAQWSVPSFICNAELRRRYREAQQ